MRKNKSSGLSLWVMLVGLILVSQSMLLGEEGLTAEQLDVFKWRNIGPFTFSGRITDFAVPKGQSQIYYVATATGGIWKTEDGGISFKPIFDDYGNMSIGNIAVAPSDSNIVYVGTGEALHARSSAHGNGMWRSDDAGKTWKRTGTRTGKRWKAGAVGWMARSCAFAPASSWASTRVHAAQPAGPVWPGRNRPKHRLPGSA